LLKKDKKRKANLRRRKLKVEVERKTNEKKELNIKFIRVWGKASDLLDYFFLILIVILLGCVLIV